MSLSEEEFITCLGANLAMRRSLRPFLMPEADCRALAVEIARLPVIVAERNEVARIMRDMEVLRHLKIAGLNDQERREAQEQGR